MGAFCLLSTSRPAPWVTVYNVYNLMLYAAWMPVLAMVFPDLGSVRALSSPMLRAGSLGLFFGHHGLLLCLPVFIHCRAMCLHLPKGHLQGLRMHASYVASWCEYNNSLL